MGAALLLCVIFVGVGVAVGFVTGNAVGAIALAFLVVVGIYKLLLREQSFKPASDDFQEPHWLTLAVRVFVVVLLAAWAGATAAKWNNGAPQRAAKAAVTEAHKAAGRDATRSLESQGFHGVKVNLNDDNRSGTMRGAEVEYAAPIEKRNKAWSIGCKTTEGKMRWHHMSNGDRDHELARLVLKHEGCPALLPPRSEATVLVNN